MLAVAHTRCSSTIYDVATKTNLHIIIESTRTSYIFHRIYF